MDEPRLIRALKKSTDTILKTKKLLQQYGDAKIVLNEKFNTRYEQLMKELDELEKELREATKKY